MDKGRSMPLMLYESLDVPPSDFVAYVKKAQKELFNEWQKQGLFPKMATSFASDGSGGDDHSEMIKDNKRLFFEFASVNLEENEVEMILNILEANFAKWQREATNSSAQNAFTLRLLARHEFCGHVVGKNGDTVKRINEEFGVDAFVSKQKTIIPIRGQNFSRIVITANKIGNIRQAREEIGNLIEKASFMMANYGGRQSKPSKGGAIVGEGDSTVWDCIHVPTDSNFVKEMQQILEKRKIDFQLKQNETDNGSQLLLMHGLPHNVVFAKTEIAQLTKQFISQNGEENWMPSGIGVGPKMPKNAGMANRQLLPLETNGNKSTCMVDGGKQQGNLNSTKKTIKFDPNVGGEGGGGNHLKPAVQQQQACNTQILIPKMALPSLVGFQGSIIKGLEAKFGVKMRLLGENHLEYKNGRTLNIRGKTEEDVEKAREYVDKEFILKKWEEKYNIGQRVYTSDKTITERERKLPEALTHNEERMTKIQKCSGIVDYYYKSNIQNGLRTVILRGTKYCLDLAEAELDKYVAEATTPIAAEKRNMFLTRSNDSDDDCIGLPEKLVKQQQQPQHMPKSNTTNQMKKDGMNSSATKRMNTAVVKPLGGFVLPNEQKKPTNPLDDGISVFTLEQSCCTEHPEMNDVDEDDDKEERLSTTETLTEQNDEGNGHSMNSCTNSSSKHGSREMDGNYQMMYEMMKVCLQNIKMKEEQLQEQKCENDKLKKQLELKDKEILKFGMEPCIQCGVAKRSIVFIPCAHMLYCAKCSANSVQCPLCPAAAEVLTTKAKKAVRYS